MRQRICNIANAILRPLKITALKTKDFSEILMLNENLIALYNDRCAEDEKRNNELVCVVFSKDRAMQLHAFLTSFREKITPSIAAHVLYSASGQDHQQSYDQLQELHRDLPVTFHKQTNSKSFRDDLISLLATFPEDKIIFFVDDIVVVENVDLNDLLGFDTDKFVPSLRMGLNIKENYTTNTGQPLPDIQTRTEADPDKIVWHWHQGTLDWSYPLSVDGHIFSRREILSMLRLLQFSAPNTMEDALQSFNPIFTNRFGVACSKSKIINIPCNKVQDENKNFHGNIHQDLLLEKWQGGFAIDLEPIYGYINKSPHEEIDIHFIKRKTIA